MNWCVFLSDNRNGIKNCINLLFLSSAAQSRFLGSHVIVVILGFLVDAIFSFLFTTCSSLLSFKIFLHLGLLLYFFAELEIPRSTACGGKRQRDMVWWSVGGLIGLRLEQENHYYFTFRGERLGAARTHSHPCTHTQCACSDLRLAPATCTVGAILTCRLGW